MPHPTSFSGLPAEIHLNIVKYCPPKTILSLLRTSKVLYTRCLRQLYQDINLSVHNDAVYAVAMGDEWPDKAYKLRLADLDWLKLGRQNQANFLRIMRETPEMGSKVRSLKWTFFEPLSPGFPDEPTLELTGLWEVLSSMNNATTVDMGAVAAFETPPKLSSIPQGLRLFPSATSITLVGYMTSELANAILDGSNTARVEHLHLNSLRAFDSSIHYAANMGKLHNTPFLEQQFLPTIIDQCTSLRTLTIRENGHLWERNNPNIEFASYGSIRKRYAELLQQAKPTLEEFTFVACPSVEKATYGDHMPRMYWLLIDWTLIKGPWPRLREIHLPTLDSHRQSPREWASDFLKSIGPRDTPAPAIHIMDETF